MLSSTHLNQMNALLGCTAARASIHCSWSKVSSNGQLDVSFLRGDPHGSAAAPRLYHGVWSGERALLGCTWSDDAALIQSYLSACRGRTREFNDRAEETLDLESLFDADRCVSLASPSFANLPERTAGRHVRSLGDQSEGERSEVRIHARVKRGFIVPGTLWCGSGNKAPSYADLGVFSDTDSCCREHDQCKHTILSFQSDFGVFNSNIFTMSHCDCDNKFRSCLMEANDSIADVVGYTFFNLLKMHCFTFSHQLQCAERNWFGIESQEGCVNSTCSDINSTASAQLQETNASRPHLLSSAAATDTVPASSPTPSVTAATDSTNSTDAEASASTVRRDGLGNVVPSTPEDRSCVLYKELDECKNKILPQQRKYVQPCFHINVCVQGRPKPFSRFSFRSPPHHQMQLACTSTVVKAELPRLDPTSVEVAKQRHLQAERRRGRRPDTTKAKRKDRAVRLYKLCVRMTRPKQTGKNRKQVQSTEPPRITGTRVN
uniref:phospholipase A2 n=1 Tax=Poecilia reticulata TaxID=8081 RepID=A0A3P9PRP4_POERE